MSFVAALNTISMGFLFALITHIMDLFVALKREVWILWFVKNSQTKLLKSLSVHEPTQQMKINCERENKFMSFIHKKNTQNLTLEIDYTQKLHWRLTIKSYNFDIKCQCNSVYQRHFFLGGGD